MRPPRRSVHPSSITSATERPRGASSEPATDESALLARIRSGDTDAFDSVFNTYALVLCRIAYGYLHDAERAEEVAQDVLLNVWHRRAALTIHGTLRAYLYAATRHGALNVLRDTRVADRHHRDLVGPEGHIVFGEPPALASDVVADKELQQALSQAITELPTRCRETLLLRWRANLSCADVAQVMGVSIKTVEMQRQRAVTILRQKLARFFT